LLRRGFVGVETRARLRPVALTLTKRRRDNDVLRTQSGRPSRDGRLRHT